MVFDTIKVGENRVVAGGCIEVIYIYKAEDFLENLPYDINPELVRLCKFTTDSNSKQQYSLTSPSPIVTYRFKESQKKTKEQKLGGDQFYVLINRV